MSKEYYVTKENSDFFVNRPNGGVLTRAANVDNAKYICAELNRLLHRIRAREEDELEQFPPISLEASIKNTESAPKYDPCREFKAGDMVRVRKIHGNLPQCRYNGMVKIKEGDCCTIHEKEHRNLYWFTTPSGENWCFDIAYFELVTPVEEFEPYRVGTGIDSQLLYCNNELFAEFEKTEDAKRVCDLLNAEYRKEMEKWLFQTL